MDTSLFLTWDVFSNNFHLLRNSSQAWDSGNLEWGNHPARNSGNTKPSRNLESPAKVQSNPLLSLPAEHPSLGSQFGSLAVAPGGFGVRMSGKTGGIRGRQGSDGSVLPAATWPCIRACFHDNSR